MAEVQSGGKRKRPRGQAGEETERVGGGPHDTDESKNVMDKVLEQIGLLSNSVNTLSGTVNSLDKKMRRILKSQKAHAQALKALELSAQFSAEYGDPFEYSEGAATEKRDPDFRKRVIEFYGSEVAIKIIKKRSSGKTKTVFRKRIVCAATGEPMPASNVIASHLFKHLWANRKHQLDLDSIDNPRNGLMLCKGVESAYDNSQPSIIQKDGGLRIHILDPSLKSIKVLDHTRSLLADRFQEHDDEGIKARNSDVFRNEPDFQSMTFGDLEGRALVLPVHKQPFDRCLCFQAHQARKRAVGLGWLSKATDFDFDDFWSEGASYLEKVRAWQATSRP
ncbi:hypothetical protein KFL_010050020 [Klebsormidium nitens]|uniref:HNH nuclease domain-containing protein n=1 Tax=Klebsormidium nitens TaxID=105231 RepID=A0A1Y1IU92_KLENI|nr:hypothetical protein KFL_010050020 [Klebsormidium nitens]|eukprot:GAQ92396.1 hypothetical protein KFL_010050020 [Klebsormidium nitens]